MISKSNFQTYTEHTRCEIVRWIQDNLTITIGSGNAFVQSGNKPLPELMMVQILFE